MKEEKTPYECQIFVAAAEGFPLTVIGTDKNLTLIRCFFFFHGGIPFFSEGHDPLF